jgi:hypothetical protein
MTVFPPHMPNRQMSLVVQAMPSSHVAPSSANWLGEQTPVVWLHTPRVWHWSSAAQTTGLDPVHMPPWHVSVCVQAFPSLQLVPSVLFGFEQVPVAGPQVPTAWHWSSAVQTTGFDPVHTPPWHVSVCVQALRSSQFVPSIADGFEQVPVAGSQAPAAWH